MKLSSELNQLILRRLNEEDSVNYRCAYSFECYT